MQKFQKKCCENFFQIQNFQLTPFELLVQFHLKSIPFEHHPLFFNLFFCCFIFAIQTKKKIIKLLQFQETNIFKNLSYNSTLFQKKKNHIF